MWIRRDTYIRALHRAELAEKHAETVLQALIKLQNRPQPDPIVVPPAPLPDTASIVKEAIGGVAVIVNGWKETAIAGLVSPPASQPALSMDAYGLDNRGGIPENLDGFIPPWEEMGTPTRAGWVNPPQNGNYKPYVPGEGNVLPPEGGVE